MMDEVINYNFNDVIFTKHLAQHVGDQLNLRVGIEKEYGLNVMSRDGVSTGVSLLLRLYSNKTGKKEQEIRQLRTHREGLSLAECIVPSVWFNTKEFNALLEDYKNGTRANISQKVTFKGKVYSYGIGGLHSEDDSRKSPVLLNFNATISRKSDLKAKDISESLLTQISYSGWD